MPNKISKKILSLILLLLIFSPLFVFSQEIEYPKIPGVATPTATTTFPAYIKYLFNFAIVVSGLIAFGVMVWGGILYLTSAGDPERISQAKYKIFGGLLGTVIILSSYLILYTINPQLLGLGLPVVEPTRGVWLISSDGKKVNVYESQRSFSFENLEKIEFISKKEELPAIYIYTDENYKGTEEQIINSGPGPTLSSIKSIFLLWKRPGVYLCPTTETVTVSLPSGDIDICKQRPLYISGSVPNLSDYNFDNKAKSIQIINPKEGYYRLLLFEDFNYESHSKGCPIVLSDDIKKIDDLNSPQDSPTRAWDYNDPPIGQDTLSSIIVSYFDPNTQISGTITFYKKTDCPATAEEETLEYNIPPPPAALIGVSHLSGEWDNQIRSLMINGPGGVALATEENFEGRCKFFTTSEEYGYTVDKERGCIPRLPNFVCDPFLFFPETCPTSLIIIPYE